MDWANQPNPFRAYAGAAKVALPLSSQDPGLDYGMLYTPCPPEAAPLTRTTVAAFLELALGLSAWKAIGHDRWALRINPSSGNLHPTEAYLLPSQVAGLADGLYHYAPQDHHLEQRIILPPATGQALATHLGAPALLVALSSITWREAWKYGERAFRYCQHDVGHALAALRFSARLQGWGLTYQPDIGERHLARLLGFNRTDWWPLEEETPELLTLVTPPIFNRPASLLPSGFVREIESLPITGQPNRLSPECRDWTVLQQVTRATCQEAEAWRSQGFSSAETVSTPPTGQPAAAVIRQRRSAVAFDHHGRMLRHDFLGLLAATQPLTDRPPFDVHLGAPQISLLLFVHQVEELASGIYLFIRQPEHHEALNAALDPTFLWHQVTTDHPLYLLREGDYRSTAADLACWQEIAGASVFSLAMLAEFQTTVAEKPYRYRRLYWEAGMIGQVLYLEAEARGYRGTGIGCYFDDAVHKLIGIEGQSWQDLYHFTVGQPIDDPRLQTLPPYAHLDHRVSRTEIISAKNIR
jgi:SagB-type dehydrogenase family enzyme